MLLFKRYNDLIQSCWTFHIDTGDKLLSLAFAAIESDQFTLSALWDAINYCQKSERKHLHTAKRMLIQTFWRFLTGQHLLGTQLYAFHPAETIGNNRAFVETTIEFLVEASIHCTKSEHLNTVSLLMLNPIDNVFDDECSDSGDIAMFCMFDLCFPGESNEFTHSAVHRQWF